MNYENEKSIHKVFCKLEKFDEELNYIGVKNSNVIPLSYFEILDNNKYKIHTIDNMAYKGRAIDINLKNPITGRHMTGSSSGTAINVFLKINDIGVGTDGGGSVLAPACSLNLFGFISPLICEEEMKLNKKESTDGLYFTPSIGYITRDLDSLYKIIEDTVGLGIENYNKKVLVSRPVVEFHENAFNRIQEQISDYEVVNLKYDGLNRQGMINELLKFDFNSNILITFEGPVDLFGYGDSIIGHYNNYAKDIQEKGHKYYLKVVNMMNLSAIIVPTEDLSLGVLIVGKSDISTYSSMLKIARKIKVNRSELENKYFNIRRRDG